MMSELERLTEALDNYDEWMNGASWAVEDLLDDLASAARAYRDLLANGPDYEAGLRMMVTWFTHFENTDAPKDPAHLYAMTVEVVDAAIGSVYPKEAENE